MDTERNFLKGLSGLTKWGHFSTDAREARGKMEAELARESFWTLLE